MHVVKKILERSSVINTFLAYDLIRFALKIRANPSIKERMNPGKIPKIIHYVWLGGNDIPEECKKCINSWKTLHPEWEIMRWDESNFPVNNYRYAKDAFKQKQWAFASDVARIHALYNYGGIYLDTDVITLKSLDPLLDQSCFFCYEGNTQIGTATIGAHKGHPLMQLILEWYKHINLRRAYLPVANVRFISKIVRLFYDARLDGRELHLKNDVTIFPRDFFLPEKINGEWKTTNNTYAIHLSTGLW